MENTPSSKRFVRWGLFLVLSFLLGIAFERVEVPYWLGAESERANAVEKYKQALSRIDQHYIEDVSSEKLTRTALRAIARQELDRHSSYMAPDRYESFSTGTSGNYKGVGIRVSKDEKSGFIKVVYPFRGSPALDKGIQPGDLITKVNGTSIKDLSLDEAVTRIKGKKGTKVTLTIRSNGTDRDVTLTRQVVDIPTVAQWGVLSTEKGPVGYISVRQFSETTVPAFKDALKRLQQEKVQGLIIDLRRNPGGLLSASIEMADLFLEAGKDIVTVRYRNRSPEIHRAQDKPFWSKEPVALLVDGDSASASEVFAGALQDHNRAVLVGTRTFGKGSVQQLFPFSGSGDALKITVARYYTPAGRAIDRGAAKSASQKTSGKKGSGTSENTPHGLAPDHIVQIAGDEKTREARWQKLMDAWQEGKSTKASRQLSLDLYRDPQLQKALDVLVGDMGERAKTPAPASEKATGN